MSKRGQKRREILIPCEVYSRVVGYFRPVKQWNNGKQEEYVDRKEFVVQRQGAEIRAV